MIILSGGMVRSGSTWMFNVLRTIMMQKHDDVWAGWIGDYKDVANEHRVIKTHKYLSELVDEADYVFYSFRDLRDVAASIKRKTGTLPTNEQLDRAIEMFYKWYEIANFSMRYEEMIRDDAVVIQKVANQLKHPVNSDEMIETLNGMQHAKPGQLYDKTNLYHPNHITDGRHHSWDGVLEPDYVQNIEKRYKQWLTKMGYLE